MNKFILASALLFALTNVPSFAQDPCDFVGGCDANGATCDALSNCGECDDCRIKRLLGGCAEKGVMFSGDLVQSYQGGVDGGLRRHDKYGGLATYGMLLDFDKLGLWQGGLLQIGAQSQFGESIN